jgi:hypothetical protein
MTSAREITQRMLDDRDAAREASRQSEARKIVALHDAGKLDWPETLIEQIRAQITSA